MITRVDRLFREEARRYHLRMHCEECALFDDERGLCAHGYPTEPHRKVPSLEEINEIRFCKHFEAA
ncbi:MAG: hypothetical protein N2515_11070 [Deltaproteobacteria bacterium]|nr:hypothetical protein [Deltaproteobacteria bacterium]